MDIEYFENVSFRCGHVLNLSTSNLDVKLYETLGKLIPPGGSFMVAYQMFWGRSQIHEDTDLLSLRELLP